jgi:hypothetical protein
MQKQNSERLPTIAAGSLCPFSAITISPCEALCGCHYRKLSCSLLYFTISTSLNYIITKSELVQLELDYKSRPQKPTNGGPQITKSLCTQGRREEDIKKTWTRPNSAPPTSIVAMKHLKKAK